MIKIESIWKRIVDKNLKRLSEKQKWRRSIINDSNFRKIKKIAGLNDYDDPFDPCILKN